MVSELSKASVYTEFDGLAELRAKAQQNSPEAVKAVAKQFEALFLEMMLKSMREASSSTDDGLFDSEQSLLYRDMYDKQLALHLSEGQGIGLAEMLTRQLQGLQGAPQRPQKPATMIMPIIPEDGGAGAAKPLSSTAVAVPEVPVAEPVTESIRESDPVRFDSPEAFVRHLWPHAKAAAEKLGVDPRALLAQAALETGWGKAVIRHPDGSSSYNLFNIKADHRWEGERVVKQTLEYRDGIARQERAPFRAYASYAESFEDYASFIRSQPRYEQALENASDPGAYIRELQKAGYATDPNYADKINGIMGRDLLASAGGLKNG